MKKYMYIFGSLEMILGALILCVSSIIRECIPMWGYIEFKKLASGMYSANDYNVPFTFVTVVCAVLIALGLAQVAYALISKSEK